MHTDGLPPLIVDDYSNSQFDGPQRRADGMIVHPSTGDSIPSCITVTTVSPEWATEKQKWHHDVVKAMAGIPNPAEFVAAVDDLLAEGYFAKFICPPEVREKLDRLRTARGKGK